MATLITLRTLISSCSCFIHIPGKSKEIPIFAPQLYMVVAGISNLAEAKMSDTRVVSQFYRDPICRYSSEMKIWINNRGYIELQWPFEESKFLNVVHFPKSQIKYDVLYNALYENEHFAEGGNKSCTTYGWGARRYNLSISAETKSSSIIGKMNVQFLSYSKCLNRFYAKSLNSTFENMNMFCASGVRRKQLQKGLLCSKDQGAPLICNNTLIAIGTPITRCGYNSQFSFFQKLNITQMLDFSTLEKVIIGKGSKHKLSILLVTLPIFFIIYKHFLIL
ncbi:uncharacterized protein LOC106672077 [Cimex lectularius]|uniref:Peptidase S1 domain-containing protein n=1 Tax=Cimex lectularius TaxID=79782 RepID=A0A8I6S6E2_CIMLE|nr:uncharacterized protein LOC106672077 [Cimex lectularius]